MKELNLDKMRTSLLDSVAHYSLESTDFELNLNELVGKKVSFKFLGQINCIHCQKLTKKSFSGGYCYPCSIKLAECDLCILKPELCHFAKGTCREPEWGQSHCMIEHYVYLANSGGLKVGITRTTQVPFRFIDQGASAALPILKVKTRLQSGLFEKLFKTELSDKTDWRKMLKGQVIEMDLREKRDELFDAFGDDIDQLDDELGGDQIELLDEQEIIDISYPVLVYPEKVQSLSFDKTSEVGGILRGIKGQYLLFDTGVINIRSHAGYKVQIDY